MCEVCVCVCVCMCEVCVCVCVECVCVWERESEIKSACVWTSNKDRYIYRCECILMSLRSKAARVHVDYVRAQPWETFLRSHTHTRTHTHIPLSLAHTRIQTHFQPSSTHSLISIPQLKNHLSPGNFTWNVCTPHILWIFPFGGPLS